MTIDELKLAAVLIGFPFVIYMIISLAQFILAVRDYSAGSGCGNAGDEE